MSTRRHFLKTAALAAAAPTVATTACAPPDAPAAMSQGQGTAGLQADLEDALVRHNVVGANAAVYHRGEIHRAAAGLVNNTTGIEMTPETVMHIGSITKIFNTAIVMQLVDDGLVDLDAPVVSYVPDFQLRDPAHRDQITVRMLVNHASGIDGEMVPEQGHDQETIDRAMPRFADMGKVHEPGQDCSYCNTAHVVAGYMAQQLRGESWYDQVKERIYAPLGMEHSVILPEDALLHRASVGHFMDPRTGEHTRTSFAFLPISFAPAGATAMMSASDLVTFAAAHMNGGVGPNGGRILTAESVTAMQTPTNRYRGLDVLTDFGLGWMMPGNGIVSHSGGGPGIYSTLTARPEDDFAVAVLTNSPHGGVVAAELTAKWMEEAIGTSPPTLPTREIIDEPVDVARYVGVYENITQRTEIVESNGGIAASFQSKIRAYDDSTLDPTPPIPIMPTGDDAFTIPGPDGNATGALLTFLDEGLDGRMQRYAQGARLIPRRG